MFAEIKYDGERVQVGFKVGLVVVFKCLSKVIMPLLHLLVTNTNIPLNHTSS